MGAARHPRRPGQARVLRRAGQAARDAPALASVNAKVPPELRAQRELNKARVPRIAQYILGNPNDYPSPPWSPSSTGSHDDLDQPAELAGGRWETPSESSGLGCSALGTGAPRGSPWRPRMSRCLAPTRPASFRSL
ncbi:DNA sulfur modification protein DndB [Sorangium sp. So ce291]|uniref:DNA sulfur modification protein DndB n=1 Tax=Sorangium sp. So ce291 TaxID=3133294 RepID=UPI003F640761